MRRDGTLGNNNRPLLSYPILSYLVLLLLFLALFSILALGFFGFFSDYDSPSPTSHLFRSFSFSSSQLVFVSISISVSASVSVFSFFCFFFFCVFGSFLLGYGGGEAAGLRRRECVASIIITTPLLHVITNQLIFFCRFVGVIVGGV